MIVSWDRFVTIFCCSLILRGVGIYFFHFFFINWSKHLSVRQWSDSNIHDAKWRYCYEAIWLHKCLAKRVIHTSNHSLWWFIWKLYFDSASRTPFQFHDIGTYFDLIIQTLWQPWIFMILLDILIIFFLDNYSYIKHHSFDDWFLNE